MTASWDSFGPGPRPRRIRGGEIPAPSATSWREQQRHAREAAKAHAKAARRAPDHDQPAAGIRLGARKSLRILTAIGSAGTHGGAQLTFITTGAKPMF